MLQKAAKNFHVSVHLVLLHPRRRGKPDAEDIGLKEQSPSG